MLIGDFKEITPLRVIPFVAVGESIYLEVSSESEKSDELYRKAGGKTDDDWVTERPQEPTTHEHVRPDSPACPSL